ncbi:Delta-like protein [Caenorhabditis elegans]|uniref:Delta-like protein n=1 Tax=Caenorhabditis elegans TaxID=6239 RepID=O45602_CAEEL|nr:Delta-like protein [Caenorhabditis elegans]CAB07218.2 Delta-like protein [Caenorhabditis elegans]|eukprot:NP_502148.2 Delta-like protein [Caenorhabditis elegans]
MKLIIKYTVLTLFYAQLINCSGYLEVHLRSPHEQPATVNISTDVQNEESNVFEVILKPNVVFNVTRIPVDFNKTYNLIIKSEANDGKSKMTMESNLTPRVGLISPIQVTRTFDGLRIIIECDENWFGEKCDVFCDNIEQRLHGKRCNYRGVPSCLNMFTGAGCMKMITPMDCSCKNNGKCVDSAETPICECTRGFKGDTCEEMHETIKAAINVQQEEIGCGGSIHNSIMENLVLNQMREVKQDTMFQLLRSLVGAIFGAISSVLPIDGTLGNAACNNSLVDSVSELDGSGVFPEEGSGITFLD